VGAVELHLELGSIAPTPSKRTNKQKIVFKKDVGTAWWLCGALLFRWRA